MSAIRRIPSGVSENPEFFDLTPLTVGGFRFRASSATPVGRPSLAQWTAAFQFASAAVDSSPYWLGDLLEYAAGRDDWRERLDQAKSVTKLAEQTLHNHQHIAKRVKGDARRVSPSFSHSREVAKLSSEREQVQWLDRAKAEGWTARELAVNIKRADRQRTIEGQARLEGVYRVVYADPPWLYGNTPPSGSGAQAHYAGMTIEALCKLPVEAHADPNAVLFMWVTAPMLYEEPGPREVIRAWGFTPKTGMVWDKVNHGFGNYVSIRHEHLLIATRGRCLPDRPTPMPDSVQTERQDGEHSSKPHSFRRLIETLYDGPRVELFAREQHDGWTSFGNDSRLWHKDAARSAQEATHGEETGVQHDGPGAATADCKQGRQDGAPEVDRARVDA